MRGHKGEVSLGEFVLVDIPYGMDYYGDIMEGDSLKVLLKTKYFEIYSCDLNGYFLFTLDSDEFEEHFISLEELREQQINEILK
jgi:hypothetical protein